MAVQPHQPAPSRDTVAEIGQYLAPELRKVEAILQGIVDSDSQMIREVGEYVALTSGKKLRPMLNLLATRAFNPTGEVSVQIAAAMELVHVATLLHDDVIDKAQIRRGQQSVNARWGDDVAILMADYLYSAAFELLLENLVAPPLRMVCKVTRRMCEGEMFQIERRGAWLTSEDYLHICSCKTGWLFSACAALGGELAHLESDHVARLAAFGMDFGLAFQITDDTLDYTAQSESWGKAVGSDLAAGKQTLPLILTLQHADEDEAAELRRALGEGGDPEIIHRAMARHRAIERSLDVARRYSSQSVEHLAPLEVRDPVAYEYLVMLPEYVIDRQY